MTEEPRADAQDEEMVDDEMPSGPERPDGGSGMEPASGGSDELGTGPGSQQGAPR